MVRPGPAALAWAALLTALDAAVAAVVASYRLCLRDLHALDSFPGVFTLEERPPRDFFPALRFTVRRCSISGRRVLIPFLLSGTVLPCYATPISRPPGRNARKKRRRTLPRCGPQ
jgi:hypothetical protein